MVVVTGAGTVVCCVVVVELCEALSVSQPVSDNRATAAKQAMISIFIILIVVWFVILPAYDYNVDSLWAIRCNPNRRHTPSSERALNG